jgi:hypothetical protein
LFSSGRHETLALFVALCPVSWLVGCAHGAFDEQSIGTAVGIVLLQHGAHIHLKKGQMSQK